MLCCCFFSKRHLNESRNFGILGFDFLFFGQVVKSFQHGRCKQQQTTKIARLRKLLGNLLCDMVLGSGISICKQVDCNLEGKLYVPMDSIKQIREDSNLKLRIRVRSGLGIRANSNLHPYRQERDDGHRQGRRSRTEGAGHRQDGDRQDRQGRRRRLEGAGHRQGRVQAAEQGHQRPAAEVGQSGRPGERGQRLPTPGIRLVRRRLGTWTRSGQSPRPQRSTQKWLQRQCPLPQRPLWSLVWSRRARSQQRKKRKRGTASKNKWKNCVFRPQKPPTNFYAAVWRGRK